MITDEILTKENILSLSNGKLVAGYVYLRSYWEQLTKNGGTYLVGKMDCIGDIGFKVWSGDTLNQMKENYYVDKICHIHGEVNQYNGTISIIIKECSEYTGTELTPDMFFEQKYNADELWNRLTMILEKKCSVQAMQVFYTVVNPIKDRFMKEYAAIFFHDACVSGLLAHTVKLMSVSQIIKFYPQINKVVDDDLLFICAALHDIGKTLEYQNGTMSELGMKMSHLTLGLRLIEPHRDSIIALKGEEFYDSLASVIQQHHGEFGERPRTMVAYIIHKMDMLEAQLTDIDDAINAATTNQVKIDDCKLAI